ncbi:MBL fold metallo-hydrolase [Paenibacillus sp. NPDC057934]|uniref:MBL fold metallo-hydrolase n=1 Tax=Paenibacillus sp. NPDC057934 TaxID=3346282 RepID=UPI0036D8285E
MVSGKRIRENEGFPRKADITSWDNGAILQISVPMDPPLRRVNSYLLPGPGGTVTVIDPGPHKEESVLAWQGVLQELDLRWEQVQDIVVTHHHPDHYGLSGWMQERSGGKVWMTERAHAEASLMWGEKSIMNETLPLFFARHGMPEALTAEIRVHLESFTPQVTPQPEITALDPAAPFTMGGRVWQPVVTGGHAPGHVSFYHAGSGAMICGDAVLPQISPNISLHPGGDGGPLLTFLQGLEQLGSYPVSFAYPGHREPFSGFTERTQSLLRHHEERLDTAEALLQGGLLSGFAICEALFRGRVTTAHQMRFAMSEALAHLAELVRRGRIVESGTENAILFALAKSG